MENNLSNLMHLLKNDYDTENELLLKEIHDKIVAERYNEINTLKSKIKYVNENIILKVKTEYQ